ncbi:hypothetical protein N9X48_07220 [Luminiphilus sp.]|nr:hypothetical protein [Luminiphilus sp.]
MSYVLRSGDRSMAFYTEALGRYYGKRNACDKPLSDTLPRTSGQLNKASEMIRIRWSSTQRSPNFSGLCGIRMG